MNDIYIEQLVKQKSKTENQVYKGIGIFVVAACVLLGFFFHVVFLLIAFALGAACYFLFQFLDIEFEYLYVNGELDFDKIYAKARRKSMLTVQMAHLEMMAEKGSHHLDSLRTMQHKSYDFTSQEENKKVYEMYIHTEKELFQIFFEPNEEIVNAIRQMSPRKIIVA